LRAADVAMRVTSTAKILPAAARLRIVVYVVMALHAAKLFHVLPIANIFDGMPLTEYHHSQIYADVVNDRLFTARSGRSWGYDPYVGAGQPVGAGMVKESHAAILFDRCLRRWIDPSATIKLFEWMALFLGPFLIFMAARMFFFDEATSAIALCLAVAGSFSFGYLSPALIYRGHVAFWLAAHLALFHGAAFFSGAARGSRWALAAYTLSTPLLLLLDPAVAFVQIVPVLAVFSIAPGRRRGIALGCTLAAVAMALPFNAFWIRPFFLFRGFGAVLTEWPTQAVRSLRMLLFPVVWEPLSVAWAAFRAAIVVMGVSELVLTRVTNRRQVRTMTAWAGTLMFVAFFSGGIEWCEALEPRRFGLAFVLLLSLPASSFMSKVLLKPGSMRIIIFVWTLWMSVSYQATTSRRPAAIRDRLIPQETALLPVLHNLPSDRRVLIEYTPAINDLLRIAAPARRPYVGFPSTWVETTFATSGLFTQSGDHMDLFGMPASYYDAPKLLEALERYNVGTVVVTSSRGNAFAESFPDVFRLRRAAGSSEPNFIYDVPHSKKGYFLTGSGSLSFDRDIIRIRKASAGPIVLSLHFVPGLSTRPAQLLKPLFMKGDPIPFISFDNASAARDIEIRYEPR
jgi:hypothetical protein